MTLQEIREKVNKLAADMKAMVEKATSEQRDLTAEENTQFDTMDSDREGLLATERRLAKVASFEEGQGRRTEPRQPNTEPRRQESRGEVRNIDRAEALRSWFLATSPDNQLTEQQRQIAHRAGVDLNSKYLRIVLPAYAPRSLSREDMKEWEERALQVGSASPDVGGRYTVPDETMRSLEVALLAFGGMRQVSTVLRTTTGADLPMPTVNDTSNKGAILAESAQAGYQDPSFGQLVLNSFKYTSKEIKVSVEFLQDTAINAAEVIGRLLGTRIARITNDHFTTGTGSSQPLGVIAAATASGITSATATTISYDNIVDLEHSVDPEYRTNARFMFNDTTLKLLKKIKIAQYSGDTAGMPLWRPGMSAGVPDTIDNFPYSINQSMANPTTGQKAMAFGDFSKYQIRDVRDVTLVRLDELYAEYGQVAFLAFSRHDGDLLDAGTHPVKYLTQA